MDTDNDGIACGGGNNSDDDGNGIDVHFVATALLSITILIHHLFNHQPGHLRRGALHARQGERGCVGGEHHPIAAQSEVRLLVRHYPQRERLRVMVRTILHYTIKHHHPLMIDVM